MLIQIEAQDIDELLAEDECLVPSVEDLLLDALIICRDTPRGIYEPEAQITSSDDSTVKITITLAHPPQFIRSNGNGAHSDVSE